MRDHVINGVDSMLRKHPNCGVLLTGDFNQLNDKFKKNKKHYRYALLVNVPTRGQSTLDKIWMNMSPVYDAPITLNSDLRITTSYARPLFRKRVNRTGHY